MAGGTSGHVSLGLAFLIIGLWHLFNCIKHHILHPNTFRTQPWYPYSRLKHLELVTIMLVTLIFTLMELFFRRTPLSPDGSIPSKNLPHFEHSIIAMSFFVYAVFAAVLDGFVGGAPRGPARHDGLAHFLQAVAFGQQLLILHLHSTDHMGIEGQYHWLLQIATGAALAATLLVAVGCSRSFVVSFIRAFSVVLQGVWLFVTGVVLWDPRWMPDGCFLKEAPGRDVVLCRGDGALERGKALVNMFFGVCLMGLTVFSMCSYLVMIKLYSREIVEYESLSKCEEEEKPTLCMPNSLPI